MDVNKAEVAQYVVQMQNGDGQAFEKLYYATNQSGYFTALKILKNEDEAQDVLQDSYVTVLEKIGSIQNPESFVGWFHQIVANKAKNILAKKKPALFASDEEAQEYTAFIADEDEIWQPEKNVDEEDVRRQVMQIIDGLTDEKRTCVLLYYYNEMSVADIAQTVGASENTVKARLFQARKDIRKEVEKLGKKNISLRGASPISLVLWALRAASKAEGAKFIAGSAATAVLEGAAAAASAGASAAAATAGGTAAGVGLTAKVAALTAVQKVIAGIVTAGVVAGAATGTAAIANQIKAKEETETETQAVEVIAEVTTAPLTDAAVIFTEAEETEAETETQLRTTEAEPPTEPTATTAAPTTAPPVTAGASAVVHTSGAPTTAARTMFTAAKPVSTAASSVSSTSAKAETTSTTAEATSETTTTAPANGNTPSPESLETTPDPTPKEKDLTKPTYRDTSTQKPKDTTTEKSKGTATVNVSYAVAGYDDSGSVTFSVDEGSAVTENQVKSKVLSELQGRYGGTIIVTPLETIQVPSAEAGKTYSYNVDVFIL